MQGARSILTLEATRPAGAGTQSNIRWSYGHETIPRHLRDVIVTEYGVADLRGKSDAEVIAAMLARDGLAASRTSLMRQAKDAGKLPKNFEIPAAHRDNHPERIAAALKPAREAGLLPSFPFGSDFTEVEQRLIPALQILQDAQRAPRRLAGLLWQGLVSSPDAADRECLARLGLDKPATWPERAYRALVSAALARSRAGSRSVIRGAKRRRNPVSCSSDRFAERIGRAFARLVARNDVYLFLFTGLRFSMNAAMPSERSSSAKVE